MNIYSILSFIFFTIYAEFSIFVLLRNFRSRINRIFAIGTFAFSLFAFYHGLIYSAPTKEAALQIVRYFTPSNSIPFCSQLLFVILLTGKNKILTFEPFLTVLIYLPAVVFSVKEYLSVSMIKDFVLTNGIWFEQVKPLNAWDIAYMSSYYFYFIASLALLIRYRITAKLLKEILMADIIITGMTISMILTLLVNHIQPFFFYRPIVPRASHIALGAYIFCIWVAVVRYNIMGDTPASLEKNPMYRKLTRREKALIPLIYDGLTYKEIALRLFISEETLKKHVRNIFTKTGIHNKTQLNILYFKKGGGI